MPAFPVIRVVSAAWWWTERTGSNVVPRGNRLGRPTNPTLDPGTGSLGFENDTELYCTGSAIRLVVAVDPMMTTRTISNKDRNMKYLKADFRTWKPRYKVF